MTIRGISNLYVTEYYVYQIKTLMEIFVLYDNSINVLHKLPVPDDEPWVIFLYISSTSKCEKEAERVLAFKRSFSKEIANFKIRRSISPDMLLHSFSTGQLSALARKSRVGTGAFTWQSYHFAYDPFGNMTQISVSGADNNAASTPSSAIMSQNTSTKAA